MLSKRKTAVRPARNMFGKPARRRLRIADVLWLAKEEVLDFLDRGYLLPLGGGTTPNNQQAANPVYFPRALVVSSDQTINQGDMVWWDPVNFTLKPCTSPNQVAVGNTGGFCGCAAGTSNPGVYPNPPGGVPSEALPGIEVQCGGSVFLATTNAEVYSPFQIVTVGADAQTVTGYNVETSANKVGFMIVPPPVSARGAPGATPAPETIVGPTRSQVWIERKFPTTALL